MSDRKSFGTIEEVLQPANLIQTQVDSYVDFLQPHAAPKERKAQGLEAVLREVFPIESYDGRSVLEYVSYNIIQPKMTEMEAMREGASYAVSLYVKLRLKEEESIKEEEIYMGELPMVTDRGSFVVNGAERVIVSQLHRSPGICFEKTAHPSGKDLYAFRIIPDRGTWLEVQFDANDLLYVYLDRRRRRRKFLLTTLLRAMGYSSDAELLDLFYKVEDKPIKKLSDEEDVSRWVLIEDVVDADKGAVLSRAFESLTKTMVKAFEKSAIKSVRVVDASIDDGAIIRALKKDPARNEEEALKDIYK